MSIPVSISECCVLSVSPQDVLHVPSPVPFFRVHDVDSDHEAECIHEDADKHVDTQRKLRLESPRLFLCAEHVEVFDEDEKEENASDDS